MTGIRDFLPTPPWEGPPVPEYLLRRYPWLKGTPKEIWARFWPFPHLPPSTTGILPDAIQKYIEIYLEPISRELKELHWANWVLDNFHKGLLTENEKNRYLKWME